MVISGALFQRRKAQLHFPLSRIPARGSAAQDSLPEQRLEEEEHAAQSQDGGIRERAASTLRQKAAMEFIRMADHRHASLFRPFDNPTSRGRIETGTARFWCPRHASNLRPSSDEEPRQDKETHDPEVGSYDVLAD